MTGIQLTDLTFGRYLCLTIRRNTRSSSIPMLMLLTRALLALITQGTVWHVLYLGATGLIVVQVAVNNLVVTTFAQRTLMIVTLSLFIAAEYFLAGTLSGLSCIIRCAITLTILLPSII